MAESTKIEWADSTFNPVVGCTKVSPACNSCYAESWAKRTGQSKLWNGERRRTSPTLWRDPLKWQAHAAEFQRIHGRRRRVFCASLADVFDNQWKPKWRADLWELISACHGLDWLLLTKRPQNIHKMLPSDWHRGYPNVWLGTTIESADYWRRFDELAQVPCQVRFISYEPALGPLNLKNHITNARPNPDWIIAGGESGPNARAANPQWFREARDDCARLEIPFLVKQWGEFNEAGVRVGKAKAGRLLDGVQHDGYPA